MCAFLKVIQTPPTVGTCPIKVSHNQQAPTLKHVFLTTVVVQNTGFNIAHFRCDRIFQLHDFRRISPECSEQKNHDSQHDEIRSSLLGQGASLRQEKIGAV